MASPFCLRILLLSAGFVAGILLIIAASGIELLGREGDAAKHLARILGTAGIVAALLHRNAVVQHRHHQLGIPL